MVFGEEWGFTKALDINKIPKKAPCATTLLSLRGCRGGFEGWVWCFRSLKSIILDLDKEYRWYLIKSGGFCVIFGDESVKVISLILDLFKGAL